MGMSQSTKKLRKLQEAIEDGEASLPMIATLLDSGLLVNSKIGHASALHYAISKKQTTVAEFLLEQGASVTSGYFTETPLHQAAAVGDIQIMMLLLAKGAEINARNHNGCTPLWYAVKEGHHSVVQYLLEQREVDVDCPCDDTFLRSTARMTSLSLAVQNQRTDIVCMLLSKGASLDVADISGRTPLHHACQLKHLTLAEMLVGHGCSLNVTDSNGYTPVHTAVRHDAASVVRLLVNAGCDVNFRKSRKNCHPLHTACEHRCPEIVAILCMAKNIDVNCRDRHMRTPLIVACKSGDVDCVQHLLGSGADINVVDGNGLTVLSLALCLEEEPSFLLRLSGLQKKSNGYLGDGCRVDGSHGFTGNGYQNVGHVEGDLGSCNCGAKYVISDHAAWKFNVEAETHNPCMLTATNAVCSTGVSMHKGVNLESSPSPDTKVEDIASISNINNNVAREPSQLSAKASSLDILHVLIQASANLNLRDEYGKTALDYAFQVLKLRSACLLLCHGAAVNRQTLVSVVHASKIKLPPRKFIRPAVVALTLTCFEFWNCLHHFFYRADFFDDDCALTEIMIKLQQPMTLARQSRSVIRRRLMENTTTSIAPLVRKLPLPNPQKQFLLLSDVAEIVSCFKYR